MKKVTTFIFGILFFVLPSFAQESGEVIMTELLWNPASNEGTTATQIIEIANTTSSSINLNNWTIDDEDADGPNTLPNVTIPAYGIAIICGGSESDYSSSFGNGQLVISISDNGETMFNMSNSPTSSSEIIQLRDDSGNLVDEVNYDDASPWPGDPDGESNYLSIPKNQMNATSNNDGANWSRSSNGVDGAYLSTTSTTWNAVETTSFGNIFGDQSLPVELTSFTAKAGDGQVVLHWNTASEINNQGFVIMRSTEQAGLYKEQDTYTTNADLKGAGNSSHSINYVWADNSVINGNTYWYKLVDVDMNGVRVEHGPVSATPQASESAGDSRVPHAFYLTNYPNPFGNGVSTGNTTISFDLSVSQSKDLPVTLTVYDLLGRKVVTLYNGTLSNVAHRFQWNGKNAAGLDVPAGVYLYTLSTPQHQQTKKMILMR